MKKNTMGKIHKVKYEEPNSPSTS